VPRLAGDFRAPHDESVPTFETVGRFVPQISKTFSSDSSSTPCHIALEPDTLACAAFGPLVVTTRVSDFDVGVTCGNRGFQGAPADASMNVLRRHIVTVREPAAMRNPIDNLQPIRGR